MKEDPPFHVVRHRKEVGGKLVTQTFSVYEDNKPFLKPPRGKKLSRREARWIVDFLNGQPIPLLRRVWDLAR